MFSRRAKQHEPLFVRFLRQLIKGARCTYVHTPYRNLANQSAPSGLDFLDFHGKR